MIAFIVGFREEAFRELIKRATDLLISPKKSPQPVVPPPQVVAVRPDHGPINGSLVTVEGHSLSGATEVLFGSKPAHFTNVSDNSLSAISPATDRPGPVTVSVTTEGGRSTGKRATYTYSEATN